MFFNVKHIFGRKERRYSERGEEEKRSREKRREREAEAEA
jgi:hypothetical protein